MAAVPAPSVPRPALNRALRRWLADELARLRPAVAASAAACHAERYRKHFAAYAHACLLLFHGLSGSASLRQSYAALADCPALLALSGLAREAEGPGISFSQLAESNTSRPAAFLGGLLAALLARARRAGRGAGAALPEELHLLDSTFLRLSLKLAPWLPGGGGRDVPGVRLQVQYAPALDLPEHVLLTDTRTNDCRGLDRAILEDPQRLAALRDHTLVLDLGYYSHARFARLLEAGVHFVTRRQAQARVASAADLPVQAPLPNADGGRIAVLRDQRVTLGSPTNRAGAVLPGLRLVTARVAPTPAAARRGARAVEYELLTDRWDLEAVEVAQLYLWRWLIETFFRWLKSHVHLSRLLGSSRNAVELTVWLAILVHLLSVLAAHALGLRRRSPALLRRLAWVLALLDLPDATGLPPPSQLSLPGWGCAAQVPL
jgi:DDE family transposase